MTFLIDADGILQVSARDLKTGNEAAIEVRPSFGLTDEEVEVMLEQSARNAESDVRYRQLVEARQEAEPVLRASEKSLEQVSGRLSQSEAAAIQVDLTNLRTALEGGDADLIRQAAYRLGGSTNGLAKLVLTDAINQAQSGHSSPIRK